MSRRKTHFLIVEIECLDAQGLKSAEDRLTAWLETFGHTACSHGFEFKSVSRKVAKGKVTKDSTS